MITNGVWKFTWMIHNDGIVYEGVMGRVTFRDIQDPRRHILFNRTCRNIDLATMVKIRHKNHGRGTIDNLQCDDSVKRFCLSILEI